MSNDERKVIYDFQFKALVEAANMLLKLTTFYFIIVGASIGYILSSTIEKNITIYLTYGLIGISITVFLISVLIGYGVIRGLTDMRMGLAALNTQVSDETNIYAFIKRGQIVSMLVAVCCAVILGIIVFGLVGLLRFQLYV